MNVSDRIADLSMLWKLASIVFPYFDRCGIDWDRAYRDYLPRVMGAETDREFHLLLAEFMNLLGDGHTDYQPPKALVRETGFLPFTLRYVRDFYCIDGAVPAYRAHCGAQVRSVNGAPFADLIREVSRYSYHVGGYVSRYRLHQILPFLLKPRDNRVETDGGSFSFDLLSAKPEDLEAVKLTLPDPYRQVGRGKLDIRLYDGGLLYVRLDDFLYAGGAEEVRAAICETPGVSGLLLDLRENIGGMTMFGAKIAELLIPGQFGACQKRTRSMTGVDLASASQITRWSPEAIEKHIAAGNTTPEEVEESRRYAANTHCDEYTGTYGEEGRAALFDGPCVLLTSRHTVSAAEDFVAMFRANRRAVIVGTATCGTTGTPLIQELSCGGAARVCSVGYRLPDGTEFIGRGITPDIECDIDLDDFRRGYDGVLRTGMEVLRSRMGQRSVSAAGAEVFLQTGRLVLRRFRPEDLDDFRVFAMDEERNRMIGNPPVSGEEDLLDFFRYMKDEEPRAYAIVLKETGRVIGNLTVYEESSLSDEGALAGLTGRELSFSLAKPYRRQGFAAEAVRAVTAHLFTVEGADYVTDGYFDFNVPSQRLHEKLGFSYLTTEQIPGPGGTSRALIFCILRREEG